MQDSLSLGLLQRLVRILKSYSTVQKLNNKGADQTGQTGLHLC